MASDYNGIQKEVRSEVLNGEGRGEARHELGNSGKGDKMIDENGVFRPGIYQRKLCEPFFGDGDSQIFPNAETAPQGLAYINVNGQDKIFILSRTSGSSWSSNERSRITEFNLSEDGRTIQHVAFSQELTLGHQGLSALIEDGILYLFSGANTGSGDNSVKGYTKIEWRGSETSNTDVTSYELMGQAGSGHPLADHNRTTPCISKDGKYIVFLTQGLWVGNSRYCVVYDRNEVERASNPLSVMPINVFKTDSPRYDDANIVQDVACDGDYIFIYRGYVHPLGANVVHIYKLNGINVGYFRVNAAVGDYSQDELIGGSSHPSQLEAEGIDIRDGNLIILSTDVWRENCPVVTYNDKNYAHISSSATTGGRTPDASTSWMPTTASSTSGTWSSSATYQVGDYSRRAKVVHELQQQMDNTVLDRGINNGLVPRESSASLHIAGSAVDISFPHGDAFQIMQYSELGQFFRNVMTINGMNMFRFYDFRDGANNDNYTQIKVVRTGGRSYTEFRAKTGFDGGGINLYGDDDSGVPGNTIIYSVGGNTNYNVRIQETGAFRPGSDSSQNLGTGGYRWNNIYGASGIVSTSDRELKQDIGEVPDKVLDAWEDVRFVQYRFKSAVTEKGAKARKHFGVIAQDIYETFERHGLNAFEYGLIGYDEWEAQEEVKDEDGSIVVEERAADRIWSVRFDECQFLEMALQRRELERLKAAR